MDNQCRERWCLIHINSVTPSLFSRLRSTSLVVLFNRRLEKFLLLLQQLFLRKPALVHLARFLLSCLYPSHAIQANALANILTFPAAAFKPHIPHPTSKK